MKNLRRTNIIYKNKMDLNSIGNFSKNNIKDKPIFDIKDKINKKFNKKVKQNPFANQSPSFPKHPCLKSNTPNKIKNDNSLFIENERKYGNLKILEI